jgi:hypothetical protein
MINNVYLPLCKIHTIRVRFKRKLHFLERLSYRIQIPNFIKIHPVRAELFLAGGWADGKTDTTKLIISFQNFANAHKNKLNIIMLIYYLIN